MKQKTLIITFVMSFLGTVSITQNVSAAIAELKVRYPVTITLSHDYERISSSCFDQVRGYTCSLPEPKPRHLLELNKSDEYYRDFERLIYELF
jgi:hypothetical protein